MFKFQGIGASLSYKYFTRKYPTLSNAFVFLRASNVFAIPSFAFFTIQESLRQKNKQHTLTGTFISGMVSGGLIGLNVGLKEALFASFLGGALSCVGFYSFIYFLKWKFSKKQEMEAREHEQVFHLKVVENLKSKFWKREEK
jgi:hypothetical protein